MTFSQVPTYMWAKGFGAFGNDKGLAICYDANGNVLITGALRATAVIGNYTLTMSSAWGGMFVAKFDQNGNVIWAKEAGQNYSGDKGTGICADSIGNIFVSGSFTAPFITFGAFTLNNSFSGSSDIFVVKYDSLGNVLWAKSAGGTSDEFAKGIAVDIKGYALVTGQLKSTTSVFGTYTLTNTDAEDAFLAKYSPTGIELWVNRTDGGSDPTYGNAVAVDSVANVLITGYFTSPTFSLGTTTLTNTGVPGTGDLFLAKYDSTGTLLWAKSSGGINDEFGNSVATDGSGNIVVAGEFNSSVWYTGVSNLIPVAYSDIFIIKYSASGIVLWAKGYGGGYFDIATGITTDISGNILTTGHFDGTGMIVGTTTLGTVGSSDMFLIKHDPTGNVLWAKAAGAPMDDYSYGVAAYGTNPAITGSFAYAFQQPLVAGSYTITGIAGSDIFVGKLGLCTSVPPAPANTTPINDQIICSGLSTTLTASSAGSIYWYSSPTSTVILNSGLTFNTPSLTTGNYTYYALANTCTVSASLTPITVTVNSCVGINEQSINPIAINLYPNPNNGLFQIKIDNEIKNGELFLFNSIGQKVHMQKISKGENNIITHGLSKGLYNCVILEDGIQVSNSKIVIE